MKTPITLILIIAISFAISSCGTIAGAVTCGKRHFYLIDAPSDLEVSFGGEDQIITSELFASTSLANVTRDYYTAAVKIPYKNKGDLSLHSTDLGQSAKIEVEPKRLGAIFWGNLIFAPIVGHIIDGVTDNNKTANPRYIDVPAALAGKSKSEWRSQGKLKQHSKQKAKKNTTTTYSSF